MNSEADLIVNTTLAGEAWVNAEVAMLIVDEEGYYIATNESAWELTGYSHSELTTLRAGRDLAGDEPSAHIYADLGRGHKTQGKKLVRRKDGRTVRCRYWGVRTTIARLPYFILLLWPETAQA
jgi:PAS domain S-box-containing protein